MLTLIDYVKRALFHFFPSWKKEQQPQYGRALTEQLRLRERDHEKLQDLLDEEDLKVSASLLCHAFAAFLSSSMYGAKNMKSGATILNIEWRVFPSGTHEISFVSEEGSDYHELTGTKGYTNHDIAYMMANIQCRMRSSYIEDFYHNPPEYGPGEILDALELIYKNADQTPEAFPGLQFRKDPDVIVFEPKEYL